ncbi:Bifunctional purine biosynthetic protein ade1 [Irineochytrium annulatum]|nr:Bifunctional purine biosynthetic protein ade1 [Irineochytrium annulatum]
MKLLGQGKVRDLYEVDERSLLFVASDRISAFDVIMKNGIPGKGKLLTQMSEFWFAHLGPVVKNHLITADISKMPGEVQARKEEFAGRCMLVKRLKILPVEAIVRGYITGSGWKEYQKNGTVCDIALPKGLRECEKLPKALFTPSTKAELGDHDENIHPSKLAEIIGKEHAEKVEKLAISLYEKELTSVKASEYALTKGIIIADTKFEFGLDENNEVVLADEVLTPDCTRYDKQYLRDYLDSIKFDRTTGIELPQNVIDNTLKKYIEVYNILTSK